MVSNYSRGRLTDDERRAFLKALGVGGTVALGSATLGDVRQALDAAPASELAPIGQAIDADLSGSLDGRLLDEHGAAFAHQAASLPAVAGKGFPTDGPREDFSKVAAAGRPIYEHLNEVGFFGSTTTHLPEFTREYLKKSVQAFVGSKALAEPLSQLDMKGGQGVDLLATVVGNAQEISDYHWVATDQIPRNEIEIGEHIPPMTKGAAGGILLWLEDLDGHFWQKRVLLTEEIRNAAVWHARSMAAGFHLMTAGAKAIADESAALSDEQLGALLSTGFAVQAIAQNLLPQDVYWITEGMRGSRRTDLKTITE
ncbi:MAG: hypothetical protein ABEJ28_00295 [Salinigranum sp.]